MYGIRLLVVLIVLLVIGVLLACECGVEKRRTSTLRRMGGKNGRSRWNGEKGDKDELVQLY